MEKIKDRYERLRKSYIELKIKYEILFKKLEREGGNLNGRRKDK